jgi:hypothetical protein
MRFAFTIFLSAALLFLVQLMAAKRILPWFGGSPAVWTTSMLFFQLLLLGGYAYAHGIATRLSPRRQAATHGMVAAAALALVAWGWWRSGLPLLPGDAWRPAGPEQAAGRILLMLAATVGLPFFALSATSPLLQRWQSYARGDRAYRLYAVSNAGSLLGLLGYPFFVEAVFDLRSQALLWSGFFALYVGGLLTCGWSVRGAANGAADDPPTGDRTPPPASPLRARDFAVWTGLAALASGLLLAVTNHLTQEVAAGPLLWALPLAIYLLTFILCFESSRWYRQPVFASLAGVATIGMLAAALVGPTLGIRWHVAIGAFFLFTFCMLCHGELARRRPEPRRLTAFFLAVAAGGAAGGCFVALVAPAVFPGYWELHALALGGWAGLAVLFWKDRDSIFHIGGRWQPIVAASFTGALGGWLWASLTGVALGLGMERGTFSLLIAALGAGLGWLVARPDFAWVRSPLWARAGVVAVIFIGECLVVAQAKGMGRDTVSLTRNFYGLVRVQNRKATPTAPAHRQLTHGQINHGFQFLDGDLRRQPVSYYSRGSGAEFAFAFHPRRALGQPLRVGALGLGVGTLAAFGRSGDAFRFYEINPAVVALAYGERAVFSYLADSPAEVSVALGDARLELERELQATGSQSFDILFMDAFSSDSIPSHLLTREAIALYRGHLRDRDSILVVNISNRFLDLRPLIAGIAGEFGLRAIIVDSRGTAPAPASSRWALLSAGWSDGLPGGSAAAEVTSEPADSGAAPILWTDNYSNLWKLLR